jgi:DNA-binding response OmpR family regulator
VACEVRRAKPNTPIIFATTQGSEPLAVTVFRAGLQDYVKLPIAPGDFLERVNSQLERAAVADRSWAQNSRKYDCGRMIVMPTLRHRTYCRKWRNMTGL